MAEATKSNLLYLFNLEEDPNEDRYPAFPLVELLQCCALIGPKLLKYFCARKGSIIGCP